MTKCVFRHTFLESERLNVRNSTTLYDSAVFCALHEQLASLGRHAQLTRCFSVVAELLVLYAAETWTLLSCDEKRWRHST